MWEQNPCGDIWRQFLPKRFILSRMQAPGEPKAFAYFFIRAKAPPRLDSAPFSTAFEPLVVTSDLAPPFTLLVSMLAPAPEAPVYSPEEIAAYKSQLISILRANHWLSIFYAGYFDLCAHNSIPLNNLATRSEKNSDLDRKGLNSMPLNRNIRLCAHVKVDGVRCGSPCLFGEVFCYFHQRMIRGVATPPQSRLHPIALIEDETSIQASLMEVINALVRNTIDARRAQLILRALHIAVKNSPRVHFQLAKNEMVRDVPEFPAAPPAPQVHQAAIVQAAALARLRVPKPISIAAPKTSAPKTAAAIEKNPVLAGTTYADRPKPPASARLAARVRARPSAYRRSGRALP